MAFMRSLIQSKPAKFIYLMLISGMMLWFWHALPRPLFTDPSSTLLESRDGRLLSAIIAEDMQWRFPEQKQVPQKFSICIQEFEDRYFKYHLGVNPLAIGRALYQNIRAGKRVSGASTISMQTIRLSRKGKPRTIGQKIIESLLAIRLEMEYSKEEILALYSSHAPFGGNVVGLDAAAWRYYGRPANDLSWSEAATLAVLPNAPSLIFPGRNKDKLRQKRNRLLKRLLSEKYIDSTTYDLSCLEPLPDKPHNIPQNAMHLLNRCLKNGQKGKRIQSTVDYHMQKQINKLAQHHHKRLSNNGIQNISALIINNSTNEVAAYIGNVADQNEEYGGMVDIITSPRSTGSILKPFLYAGMIDEGKLLPNALVSDVPAIYGNYRPLNYNHQYTGALPASQALSRSLNVPAVHMLSKYGVPRFHQKLRNLGLSTLRFRPDHYGLSLILGGAEATLWDLTNAYSLLAKTLLYTNKDSADLQSVFHQARYNKNEKTGSLIHSTLPYEASSVWWTLEAIQSTNRPSAQAGWKSFYSSPVVAWKTGTSHGNRDAWAIGITPEYTIGIWAGNADGEGRTNLTGIKAAAPFLFHIFDILKPVNWFEIPLGHMQKIEVCERSGFKASPLCPETKHIMVNSRAHRSKACPFHKIIHLDKTKQFRVTTACEEPKDIVTKKWFVLPTLMEKYYKSRNPFYKVLPPFKEGCQKQNTNVLDIIYPENHAEIMLPRDMNKEKKQVIFKAAHRNEEVELFWFIDHYFITKTKHFHEVSVGPEVGNHTLTITDEYGNSISRKFVIK